MQVFTSHSETDVQIIAAQYSKNHDFHLTIPENIQNQGYTEEEILSKLSQFNQDAREKYLSIPFPISEDGIEQDITLDFPVPSGNYYGTVS